VNIMVEQAQIVMKWYDNFNTYTPSWYVKDYEQYVCRKIIFNNYK